MKTKLQNILLCLGAAAFLAGCTGIGTKTSTQAPPPNSVSKLEAETQLKVALTEKVAQMVDSVQAPESSEKAKDEQPVLAKFEYVDFEGTKHTNTVYHPPKDDSMGILLNGVAKSLVLREALPFAELIMSGTKDDKSPPKSDK